MGDRVVDLSGGESEGVSFGALIDDQEMEKRDDRKLVAELTPFFNAIDRVFTMMRVYPPTHPLVDELIKNLIKRLEPILDREETIFFNLDAAELTTVSGSQFYAEALSEKGQFLWYASYSDGVLQMEIFREVNADELRAFLRVVNKSAQGAIASDDDTVTLLWELQLDTIKYFAVEGFVDSGSLEDFGERTEKEAIDLIVDAAVSPGGEEARELQGLFDNLNLRHLDLFTRMQIEANAKIIVPELRDQDLAYAFAVDPMLVDKLCDEWMSGADLEYRLIEALLSIIRTSPGTDGAARAAEMIANVTRQLLEGELFEEAVRVLELLHDRRDLFIETEIDPLGELLEELSDPMQIEAMVNMFQAKIELREALGRLFRLLGHQVVLKQILGLLADEKRNVVALSQLMDIVFELVDTATEGLVIAPEYLEKPIYLRRVMGELPDRDFVGWAPTARLIRKAIEAKDPEVRDLALQLEHPCWDDPNLAAQYLVPMADDPDEKIRKLALGLLAEKHNELFRNAIRDTLLARKMGGRTHAELRFLMRIFMDTAPDAAPYLRGLLQTKGWLGSDAREFAKMAAAILVEAGDAEAISHIESARGSLLTAPELKRSYGQILQRFRAGAPAAPAAPGEAE